MQGSAAAHGGIPEERVAHTGLGVLARSCARAEARPMDLHGPVSSSWLTGLASALGAHGTSK